MKSLKLPSVSRKFDAAARSLLLDFLPLVCDWFEDEFGEGSVVRWPRRIDVMTRAEIKNDMKHGGGHGVYLPDTEELRLNRDMPPVGLLANLIHELAHHVDAGLSEEMINGDIVPRCYRDLTSVVLTDEMWEEFRGHR